MRTLQIREFTIPVNEVVDINERKQLILWNGMKIQLSLSNLERMIELAEKEKFQETLGKVF